MAEQLVKVRKIRFKEIEELGKLGYLSISPEEKTVFLKATSID